MAHVKITSGVYGLKVEFNGQEMTEVRSLSLDFAVDRIATVCMESFLEQPFEFEGDPMVHINFVIPEGCELIDITTHSDEGKRMLCVRRHEGNR